MKYVMIMGNRFEEVEAVVQYDLLSRAGYQIDIYGIGTKELTGRSGLIMKVENLFTQKSDIEVDQYDGLILPGGPGVQDQLDNQELLNVIKDFHQKEKMIFAICAAPQLLDLAGILENRKFTCFPAALKAIKSGNYVNQKSVIDGHIISSIGAGTAVDGALSIIEYAESVKRAQEIADEIVYSHYS